MKKILFICHDNKYTGNGVAEEGFAGGKLGNAAQVLLEHGPQDEA